MNSQTLNDAGLDTAELDLVCGGKQWDMQVWKGALHGARAGADIGAGLAGGSDIGRAIGGAIGAVAGTVGALFA